MSPLLERDLTGLIAQIRSPLRPLGKQRDISVRDFLAQAVWLSQRLPEGQYALNLCGNRYLFLLAFCAVIIRRHTSLLPPNKNIATQKALAARYSGTYIIYDLGAKLGDSGKGLDIDPSLPALNLAELNLAASARELSGAVPDIPCPQIHDDHLCAISFTSGSTGESSPNFKYWRTLRESSRINTRYMVPGELSAAALLATVPGQHMWGLETSILNVLFANLCISDAQPLFPKDIQNTLASLPEPRVLVSTPVHLRALIASGLGFQPVARVLCATAPLAPSLAKEVEALFQGELCEIYGCSEAGSMAFRYPSRQQAWQLFEGFSFVASAAGTEVHAEHLPEVVVLQDVVNTLENRQFELCGRQADMVEIAGKRGSLQEINQTLLAINGVVDGVVFIPEHDARRVPRLVAMVVTRGELSAAQVAQAFRYKLDEAFVPRPIYLVNALPREESGKLSKKRLDALWRNLARSAAELESDA